MPAVEICPVRSRGDLCTFVKFPWRDHRGDRNSVPLLISDRMQYLAPATGPFYKTADVSLFLARRNPEVLGTVAAFVNHPAVERLGPIGRFGFFETVGEELKNILPQLLRAAEAARRAANATIPKIRMTEWDQEAAQAHHLFNVTLSHLLEHVPMSAEEFRRMADPLHMFIDLHLALLAEVDGNPVGFCVALLDINRVSLRRNDHLFPFGWLMIRRYIRQVKVVTLKLMGVLGSDSPIRPRGRIRCDIQTLLSSPFALRISG